MHGFESNRSFTSAHNLSTPTLWYPCFATQFLAPSSANRASLESAKLFSQEQQVEMSQEANTSSFPSENHENPNGLNSFVSPSEPEKRGPGHPKGSRNKPKPSDASSSTPKPRGRPRGTGSKQKAALLGEPIPKRPVGRPAKNPPAGPMSVHFRSDGERLMVRGMPAPPPRQFRGAEAANTSHSARNDGSNPISSSIPRSSAPHGEGVTNIDVPDEEDDDYSGLLNDGVGDDDGIEPPSAVDDDDPDQTDPGLLAEEEDSESTSPRVKPNGTFQGPFDKGWTSSPL
ncbi:hypothetical protein B0H16DRAFT_1483987 [Mycena metata]|uniref:Uncharacterized protein n=1 Tax=Mycena metata TaxID=1033252 RepID=A0AAD7GP27_9AGAR|nr:hypothetical protein B0H16DRAFT_1483987 [Mycena metata]